MNTGRAADGGAGGGVGGASVPASLLTAFPHPATPPLESQKRPLPRIPHWLSGTGDLTAARLASTLAPPQPIRSILLVAIAMATSLSTPAALPPVYQNRPIVTLVHPLESLPHVPFATDFITAQRIDREVFYVPVTHNQQSPALLSNAGGTVQSTHFPQPLTGSPAGSGAVISAPFVHQGAGTEFAFVTHSAETGPRLMYHSNDGTTKRLHLPDSIPDFPGLSFDEIHHPISVGNQVVFYGSSAPNVQPFIEGLYQWQNDQLTIIVDSRLLPLGTPRFGFNGDRVAFVAPGAPSTLFSYHPHSGITPLISDHDRLPADSLAIQSLQGQPSLWGSATVIRALLSSKATVILSTTGLHHRILVAPGMKLSESDQIAMLADADPMTAGDRIYFEAHTAQGAQAIFDWKDSTITTIVDTKTPLVSDTPPTAVQLLDADEQSIVFKATTGSLVSLHASLSTPDIPVIYNAPTAPLIASVGSTISLSTQSVGLPPLHFQWNHNGTPIPTLAANSPVLTIDDLTAADAGTYHLIVSNPHGSAATSIELEIASVPIIAASPDEIHLFAGAPLQVALPIQGSPTLSFQWFKENQPLPDQIDQSLWIPSVTLADAGTYRLTVSNDLGSTTSPPIQISVTHPPPNPAFEHGPFHEIASIGSPLANQPESGRLMRFQTFPSGEAIVINATLERAPEIKQLWIIKASGVSELQFTSADLSTAFPHAFDDIQHPQFDVATQSIFFAGTVDQTPIGIYRFHKNQLVNIVEPNSPVPNAPLQSYRAFRAEHGHYGNATFSATLNRTDTRGIYQANDHSISIVVNETTFLPQGFGQGTDVQFLASNGYQHLFQKQTAAVPPDFGLFRRTSDGNIQLLLRHGQSIGNHPFRFHSAITAEATNERFFVLARTTEIETLILESKNAHLRPLVTPGMPLSDGSVVSRVTSDRPHFENGRVYFTAMLTSEATRNRRVQPYEGIVYWDQDGLHPAMTAEWLSGQRYTNLHLIHAYDRTLFFTAELQRQGKTLFANPVPPRPILARINVHRHEAQLELSYPEGFQLETGPALSPPRWEPIEGFSGILVPFDQGTAFFRLRKN